MSEVSSSNPNNDPYPPGSIAPATVHRRALYVTAEAWNELWAYKEQLRADVHQFKEAIYWALGERDDFPSEPPPLAGEYRQAFWWRTELRSRSGLPVSGRPAQETSAAQCLWVEVTHGQFRPGCGVERFTTTWRDPLVKFCEYCGKTLQWPADKTSPVMSHGLGQISAADVAFLTGETDKIPHRFGSQAAIGACERSGGHTWPVNPPPADGVMCMKCGAVYQQ